MACSGTALITPDITNEDKARKRKPLGKRLLGHLGKDVILNWIV
jgi:hypothetical protein